MAPVDAKGFFGWRVMWAAFAVATFGWGIGFYGPAVFLQTLESSRGWSVESLSGAVTLHFLIGAFVVACLPHLYRRLGLPLTTRLASLALALGVCGWSLAASPWQLYVASLLSGFGWAGLGAFAINSMVQPWFDRQRPAALSTAYNGASLGGVIFSPLWVLLIGTLGFPLAAILVTGVMLLAIWHITARYLAPTPAKLGFGPDGIAMRDRTVREAQEGPAESKERLWLRRDFLTLVAGFAIGLFVQVGLIAHLVSFLSANLGVYGAGAAAGFATFCAVLGRLIVGWCLPPDFPRRRLAALTYLLQACGCLLFLFAAGEVGWLLLAVALFGLGIGNVTSLPPLIAQVEFAARDLARAIALSTAVAQGLYAFAPAFFGYLRSLSQSAGAGDAWMFVLAALGQLLAAATYLSGQLAERHQAVPLGHARGLHGTQRIDGGDRGRTDQHHEEGR